MVMARRDVLGTSSGGSIMFHPVVLQQLVKDRHDQFAGEARRDRLVRDLSSAIHQDPPARFRVRDLRWTLFRPAGA
jgi:hypothetical protein